MNQLKHQGFITLTIKNYYTKKNFIKNLDSVKKLVNIWSARGLFLSGRVTTIKSLIIRKFGYVSS